MAWEINYYNTQYLLGAVIFCAVSVVVSFALLIVNSRRANLSSIRGPFLARYTDIWALYSAWKVTHYGVDGVSRFRNLQARYGNVIRTGPRSVVVLDPAAVPIIYGVRAKLNKSDAYAPFRQAGVTTSLLSIEDEKTHSQYRKLVSNAYSMSSLKGYEPYVDDMVNRMVQVCSQYVDSQESMNISLWCHYYCFDVVSKLTMGKALGFMDADGEDVHGLREKVKAFGRYAGVVGQMPWLHRVFVNNPIMRKTKPSAFLQVVDSVIRARIEKPDPEDQPRPDLLSHFVATHLRYDLMDYNQVANSTSGNLIAGGLSPGSTFNSLCRYLATHPKSQDRLYRELLEAHVTLPAAFDKVNKLPYLEGVVREAYRLHTSSSFSLERVTGPAGLDLPQGTHIPPGVKIGCPSQTINQDSTVFGADGDQYKPERWMQREDEAFEHWDDRRKVMERTELTFGQGSRTCIGKSIAALEIFKVVATLMAQFKFDFVEEIKRGEVLVKVHRRE